MRAEDYLFVEIEDGLAVTVQFLSSLCCNTDTEGTRED